MFGFQDEIRDNTRTIQSRQGPGPQDLPTAKSLLPAGNSYLFTGGAGSLLASKVGSFLASAEAIFNVRPAHIELLTEARLETVFEAFQDEQDAVDSFFPDREVKRYDILEFVESLKLKSMEPVSAPAKSG